MKSWNPDFNQSQSDLDLFRWDNFITLFSYKELKSGKMNTNLTKLKLNPSWCSLANLLPCPSPCPSCLIFLFLCFVSFLFLCFIFLLDILPFYKFYLFNFTIFSWGILFYSIFIYSILLFFLLVSKCWYWYSLISFVFLFLFNIIFTIYKLLFRKS